MLQQPTPTPADAANAETFAPAAANQPGHPVAGAAASGANGRKEKSRYDSPNSEKRALGRRLIEARERAGMTQREASDWLGYTQQVHLCLWETGQRFPPTSAIVACAELYGTTTDFILGLVPDCDRDPVLGLQRQLTAGLAADFRRLLEQLSTAAVDTARTLVPNTAALKRLVVNVREAAAELERIRAASPVFDEEVRGGSRLVRLLETAADAAAEELARIERAERVARQRGLGGVLPAVDDLDLERYLSARPRAPGSADAEANAEAIACVEDSHE